MAKIFGVQLTRCDGMFEKSLLSHMKLTHFLPVYIFLLMMLCTQLIFTLLYTHFPGVNEKGPGLKGFEENCLTMQKCKAITFSNVSTFAKQESNFEE